MKIFFSIVLVKSYIALLACLFSLQPLFAETEDVAFDINSPLQQLVDAAHEEYPGDTASSLLLNKKINQLTFIEAVRLYAAVAGSNDQKYIIESLQRMYITTPDTRYAETILWRLACECARFCDYEKAYAYFQQFIKMFPGSSQYWNARHNEIYAVYNLCLVADFDSSMTEHLIDIAHKYISDSENISSDSYYKVILYMQHAYKVLLQKDILVMQHYATKYKYSWIAETLLGCLQRIKEILIRAENAIDYELSSDKQELDEHQAYQNAMSSIVQTSKDFFEKHDIEMPDKDNFLEQRDKLMSRLSCDGSRIVSDIDFYISNIRHQIISHMPRIELCIQE